jgi:membrane-bound ClpP family serine protease
VPDNEPITRRAGKLSQNVTWGSVLLVCALFGALFLVREFLQGTAVVRLAGGVLMVAGIGWQAKAALNNQNYRTSDSYWRGHAVFILGLVIRFAYTVSHR